jgi:hypothetical protein
MRFLRLGKRKALYVVSAKGVGIFPDTFATTRRESILRFLSRCPPDTFALDWGKAKHDGYRTVRACLEITDRDGTTRRRAIR